MLRGITQTAAEHEGAHVWMLTGYKPVPPVLRPARPSQDQPGMGSVAVHELGRRTPSALRLHSRDLPYNGSFNAFLSRRYAPFEVNGDPNKDDFEVRDLGRLAAMDDDRVSTVGAGCCDGVDGGVQQVGGVVESLAAKDGSYAKAYELVGGGRERAARSTSSKEPKELRDAYGRNVLGQSVAACAPAGRAWRALRHHRHDLLRDVLGHARGQLQDAARDARPRTLDGAYAGAAGGHDAPGHAGRARLVLVMSEFGRTPKINAQAGATTGPPCNVALFAGPGIRPAQVTRRLGPRSRLSGRAGTRRKRWSLRSTRSWVST